MRAWPAGLLLITVLGCVSDEGAGTTAAPRRSTELNPMIALQQRDQVEDQVVEVEDYGLDNLSAREG